MTLRRGTSDGWTLDYRCNVEYVKVLDNWILKMKFGGWEVQQVNTRKQSEGKRECYIKGNVLVASRR